MNALMFNKQVVYRFKMRYGQPVYVYQIASHSTNTESGAKNTVLGIQYIDKACIMTVNEARKFVYDLAYISANKDFTTGGYFNPQDRHVFIDADDMTVVPEVGDFIYAKGKMYLVREVDDTLGFIYRLDCKRILGAPIIHAASAHSALLISDGTSSTTVDKFTQDVHSVLTLTDSLVENV